MMKRLRRYLVAGILVWLPLGVTIVIVRFLIGLMDKTLVVKSKKKCVGVPPTPAERLFQGWRKM